LSQGERDLSSDGKGPSELMLGVKESELSEEEKDAVNELMELRNR